MSNHTITKTEKESTLFNKINFSSKESFDWLSYENEYHINNDEYKKLKNIYTETIPNIKELDIYQGTITSITNKEVIVDIGFKAEGIISATEFKGNIENLKNGDVIEVMVRKKDYKGQCILSYQKAKIFRNWERINKSYENGEVIIGYVASRTKGGLIVVIFDIECFLPGSHINVKPVRDYDLYVGKTLEVKVVKINPKNRNVVVSHKILIERDIQEQKVELISKLEKGQIVEGKVKNITAYGAFIDLGGVDALLHITDMSWKRIEHPSEKVELEQILNLVVLNVDREKNRVQLGIKQLEPHPWTLLDSSKFKVGDKIKGTVSQLVDYGAFIEISPGIEGLIHVSEMSWSSHLQSPQDFVQIGDQIEAIILVLNMEERKLSLSIKQLTPDPWIGIEDKYPLRSHHKGIITNFTNFGVFVELETGIRGLIYTVDLSWDKKIKHPSEFCNKGDQIEVIILGVDSKSKRLHLGHKQLTPNPWDKYEKIFTIGSIYTGYVMDIFDKGAVIKIEHNDLIVEAFSPKRFLEKEDKTYLKKDEKVNFKIIEFNKELKRIVVSHTGLFRKDEKRKIEEKNKRKKIEKSTLGGELHELIELKNQMERESNRKKK